MKKETINTFDKGLIKDLHPLTTPDNVLTDALNATLVTYNGNEMVLQNDMGNVKVGTAFLPPGYVPVGMKEHGGIIYVAAWNPETQKGLIGSFPSPKLLWENEGWSVNSNGTELVTVDLKASDFYEGDYIKTETVKANLFKFSDGTMREFHPGDKYAIAVSSTVWDTLSTYVSNNYIKLQLGVIKKDGTIEIIADASEDMFLYKLDTTYTDAQSYITENKPRVFSASSSGSLIIIVTIVTPDSFDLLRSYKLKSDNETVQVTFTGRGKIGQNVHNTTENGGLLKLYSNGDYNQSNIIIEGKDLATTFDIYPQLPYGIVKRMRRQGTINFANIKKSLGDFHEWRFFVTDDYIKLGWAYEFYNLGNKKVLDGIQMDFYDLINPASYPDSPTDTILFLKDSYSGNYEDYIRFDEHPNINKGRIYIVRISCNILNTLETITHKMLYVSELYNKYYNSVYTNSDISSECVEYEKATINDTTIDVNSQILINKQGSTKVKITNPSGSVEDIDITNVGESYFYTDIDSNNPNIDTSAGAHNYIAELKNNYTGSLRITPQYKFGTKGIIGIPNSGLLNNILNNISISSNIDTDEIEWASSSSYLFDNIVKTLPEISATKTINTGFISYNLSISDYRYIQGKSSEVQRGSYLTVAYMPLISPKYSREDLKRVFSCYDTEHMSIVAKKDNIIYSNCTLNTDGTIQEGNDPGTGDDDIGLTAAVRLLNEINPPTVSIFANANSNMHYFARRPGCRLLDNSWPPTDRRGIILPNFLIAVWKTTEPDLAWTYKFVNLITPNFWKCDSSEKWPRLDVMLRCFLSQIFIALRKKIYTEYITTDKDKYRYEEGESNVGISYNISSALTLNDIMRPYGNITYTLGEEPSGQITTLTALYNYWKTNVLPENTELTNLIPTVNVTLSSLSKTTNAKLDSDFLVNSIIRYFMGINKNTAPSDITPADPKIIKVVDTSQHAKNAAACSQQSTYNLIDGSTLTVPKPETDGTFIWTSTPALKDAGRMVAEDNYLNDECDTLYDWRGKRWTMALSLNRMFITRGALEGWTTVNDDESSFNELLVNWQFTQNKETFFKMGKGLYENEVVPGSTKDWWSFGFWSLGGGLVAVRDAPDLYWGVLMSNKSMYHYKAIGYENYTNEVIYGYDTEDLTLNTEVPTEEQWTS